jgi:hypothetical protein
MGHNRVLAHTKTDSLMLITNLEIPGHAQTRTHSALEYYQHTQKEPYFIFGLAVASADKIQFRCVGGAPGPGEKSILIQCKKLTLPENSEETKPSHLKRDRGSPHTLTHLPTAMTWDLQPETCNE